MRTVVATAIFYGDRLLTTTKPQAEKDRRLFERLQLRPQGQRAEVQAHLNVCGAVAK